MKKLWLGAFLNCIIFIACFFLLFLLSEVITIFTNITKGFFWQNFLSIITMIVIVVFSLTLSNWISFKFFLKTKLILKDRWKFSLRTAFYFGFFIFLLQIPNANIFSISLLRALSQVLGYLIGISLLILLFSIFNFISILIVNSIFNFKNSGFSNNNKNEILDA